MAAKLSFQYRSTAGVIFDVTPSLVPDIEALIDKVRGEIAAKRAAGCFIGYVSVAVSGKNGGNLKTNTEIAGYVTQCVQQEFGSKMWLVNPASYVLSPNAMGGDFMAVWADVLAGEDGSGSDFDLAYFVGPSEIWKYFSADTGPRLDTIERWLEDKAALDPVYKTIYECPVLRKSFIRHYGLHGSAMFSKGAHDEWNIVLGLNAGRSIDNYIAVYFDGRPVEPGDYQVHVATGYGTPLR